MTGGAATAALGAALAVFAGDRGLALDVYVLFVGALALLAVLRSTVGRLPPEQPSPIDRRAPGPPAGERPPDLADLELAVQLAAQSEFDLHFRMRPSLRRIAAAKLRARRIDLDAADGRAARALGPAAWDLLRPDRPRPDREARTRRLPAIETAVDALERL